MIKSSLPVLGICFSLVMCSSLLGQETFKEQQSDSVEHHNRFEELFVSPFSAFDSDVDSCVACEPDYNHFPTAELSGFIQFDTAAFDQSPASMAAFGIINNQTKVRRARLALTGDIAADVGYKLDADFSTPDSPTARDVFIDFKDRPVADRLVLGNTKVPFQLEALTSSKDFTFAERAPFFTFTPFRQLGIWVDGTYEDEMGTWSVAGFIVGKGGLVLNDSANGQGFAFRSTTLPWYEDNGRELLHIGLSYSFLVPYAKNVQYDSKLSFFTNLEPGLVTPGVPVLVDTGNIPANGVNLFNFELAGSHGWLNYQTEITYALVDQIGGPPLIFYGGYAQLGWFLTGESKPYNRKTGVFDSVEPRESFFEGGWGAWELAVRGTYLNLNDKNISGGRLNSAEFVVNWYLSKSISMKFAYVRGFINNATNGNLTLDTYGARLQLIY